MESKIWNWLEKTLHYVFIKILHLHFFEKNWGGLIQFIKFGIVGLSNTLISYVSYLIFLFFGCHYLTASILSFVVSVTNSFYWNNKYVFKNENDKKRSLIVTYIKTFMAYASTGLLLANLLLVFWIQVLHLQETIAPLVSLIITIPLNYFINKYWAFKG